MSKEVAEEYLSSLADLTVNSKPLINMLTMLADENVDHAAAIVQVIESHIQKVSPEVKLPILYLIDSIIKNVPRVYVPLFTQNIVNIFVSVFEKVDEKTRLNMYKLRQTWNDVFPPRKLYALDLRVKDIDNAWPVTAIPPTSIHLNPKFLQGNKTVSPEVTSAVTTPQITAPATSNPVVSATAESELKEQLLKKQAILIELQKKKLELELLQAKAKLEEQQQKQLKEQVPGALVVNLANRPAITEEAVKLLAQKGLLKPKAVVMPPSTESSKLNVINSKYWIPNNVMMPYNSYQNFPNVQTTSLTNASNAQNKTKIAPANTQIIEAVKSRDPRLARQQQPQSSSQPPVQQPKGSVDASYKEQEILSRQLAMLKTPLVDQVAPAAPVQRILSESNAKSHITINVERNRDKLDTKTNKKQSKDNNKSDSSSRNRSKPLSPRDSSKTSPSKSSKLTPPSRDSKISSPKRSQKRNSSPDRPRTPIKNLSCPSPPPTRKWQKKSLESYKSPKKSSKSNFSPLKQRRDFSKIEKIPKIEIIDADDKIEKKISNKKKIREEPSPKRVIKERSKSPPAKEKPENSENIPEIKIESPKKDKKKDKKSETSDKVKKSDSSSYLELIESSPSPEPPPPPIISRTGGDDSFSDKKDDASFEDDSEDDKGKRKEMTGFKDIKGMKGRNYIRRNREPSTSPQKEVSGDVDHRISSGPPEKQPRLLTAEEEIVTDIEKSLVNVSGKDVDLRLLPVGSASPSKKRLSIDAPGEEPPKKKNKSEVFDELFGNEDVDLRQLPTPNINPSELLPSPPPPPVISNGPAAPQVAAVAPLVLEGSKLSPKPEDVQQSDSMDNDEHSRESFDGTLGRYRRPRGDLKTKPEAEIKPMSLSSQLELELAPKRESYPPETPEKDRRKHFGERGSPRGELDRLGRPLLYNKLPNDPRARRESLVDSRDTDMRRFGGLIDRDRDRDSDTTINVNLIVAQAQDQLRNGTMSIPEYNEILTQVIRVNEVQKIREAQNKSRQESRRMHHRSRRSPPNRFGSRNSPPFRHEEDRRDRRPFNDIDERLPAPWRAGIRNDAGPGYSRLGYPLNANRSYDISGVERNFEDRPLKPEIWEDERSRFRRAQQIDELDPSEKRSRDVICTERTHDCVDVPKADFKILEAIAKDPMKSINIDGTPRDIRFYGDTAVVMLSWDDPKEISFEDGLRRVAIGDQNFTCALNHPYTMIMVNGNPHRIRLGAPTRELYIDGEFYEVHFGGPPVQVQLDGIQYLVQLEGPPPQVKIGDKRTDLICGKVNLIVDATVMLPLYLDAKPQRFDLRNRPYVFRFVNSLKTLLVNEVPVDIQFGGGCRQIFGYGNLHFLRLSMLPTGVIPGAVKILNMDNIGLATSASVLEAPGIPGTDSPVSTIPQLPTSSEINTERKVFDTSQQHQGRSGPLDILTSLIGGTTPSEQPVGFNYQIESKPVQPVVLPTIAEVPAVQPQPAGIPFLGANLNINDLFQRLVATGIVSTSADATTAQQPQGEAPIKPVDFSDPNSLKERQAGIINMLYSGIQCSSCGVRFAPEETVKYSRHLDWHFRQNRREKDAARKGQSRKWYYDVSDWIQFEEIEDLEERAQSWFETEATSHVDEAAEQEEIKSVPAPLGDENVLCELCRDRFDTFYNEEKEEWHLKPCVLVEEKYYHPFCYEDLINMPDESFVDKTTDSITSVKEETTIEEIKAEEIKEEPKLEENVEEIAKTIIEDLIDSVVCQEEVKEQKAEEEEKQEEIEKVKEEVKEEIEVEKPKDEEKEEPKEEEILVLENVKIEQQKNIISVDLSEKLDDEDDIVYQRKTPSPIVLDPTVKIKQEPVDEMESPVAVVDQTYTSVVSSIDGNVEMIEAPQVAPAAPSKIKITFNKPIVTETSEKKIEKTDKTDSNDAVEVAQEEDPEPLPLKPKKQRLAERDLQICLPVVKGTEVSGLCSIM